MDIAKKAGCHGLGSGGFDMKWTVLLGVFVVGCGDLVAILVGLRECCCECPEGAPQLDSSGPCKRRAGSVS